jgi:hypothetical protein
MPRQPRRRFAIRAVTALAALSLSAPCFADFHIMKITEVLAGAGGDTRIQYIEMQMDAVGQNAVGGHSLFFFDAAGNQVGTFRIPTGVDNGASGSFILLGTQEFADASAVKPDFILPRPFLMPHGGRVSFDTANASTSVDSVAYGIYTGNNGNKGNPAAALSAAAGTSLTRIARNNDNQRDFALRAPSPTNNDGETAAFAPPGPACFFEDGFDDLSNWDPIADNAGLALEPCLGVPVNADIGRVRVENNELVLFPGLKDDLGLGTPIAFTGLSNAAALKFAGEESYRVRFDLEARPGVVIAAVFARQHYLFDDAQKTIDVSSAGGMGLNFSFDSITERRSDHAHDDVRLACLQEGSPEGPGTATFSPDIIPDALLVSGTKYTLILDSEGDDVVGPLVLRAKLFVAGDPEPEDYLATWTLPVGLSVAPDDELDHGVLIAALGQPNSRFEVSDFSVCEIPRSARTVRNLGCSRQVDNSILLNWENPIGGDAEAPIAIVVNNVEVGRADGTDTSFEILDPPDADLTIQVFNFSGSPAVCALCFNDDPQPDVAGPSAVELPEGGTAAAALNSSASDDEEDGGAGLARLWSIAAQPAGASAQLSSQTDAVVEVTFDRPGDYTIRLDVTDKGCVGDGSDVKTVSLDHVVSVVPEHTDVFFRRTDSNTDGRVDLSDGVFVLNFLFLGGADPKCPDAADANDSGGIDLSDASFIFNFLFLGGREPPAPGHETCGAEDSEDGLGDCVYDRC